MAEINATNPDSLARQTRDQAIRQAEENYKKDLSVAARAKETAIKDASAAKAKAVEQVQAELDAPQKRLREARDRIEAKLRKQELDEAKRNQEQLLAKAEDTRVKALKQAEDMAKRMSVEAADTRRRAIQQAYDNEKKMKLEAQQALKTRKEAVRAGVEDERKSRQRAEQESAEAKVRGQKAAAKLSAEDALGKAKGKTENRGPEPTKIAKAPEAPKPATKTVIFKEPPKASAETAKPSEPSSAVSRTGAIKLIIDHKDADSDHMVDFENSLRKVPDIRVVMVGGTTKEGAQIIISIEKAIPLSETLRQLPMVEEVSDRAGEILIKLKPVVIFENNM